MKRNPVNILNDHVTKALKITTIALRAKIHAKRANKLTKVDLRKYKANPEKKDRIRRIIISESIKARVLLSQMLIVSSQPIMRQAFENGTDAHINYVHKNGEDHECAITEFGVNL